MKALASYNMIINKLRKLNWQASTDVSFFQDTYNIVLDQLHIILTGIVFAQFYLFL